MPQTINTNIASLTAQRNLSQSQSALQVSLNRLSSGLRINSAKDDAAGMAISERFTTQIRGLNQAVRNANDGISFAQTAEGALSTLSNALQRVRELAVQSANDTNSATDRQALNNEVQQLVAEINRVANTTQFNGQNILDGTLSTLVFQVGANQNQTISVTGVDARGSQLGARVSESASISGTNVDASIAADDLFVQGIGVDLSSLSAGDNTANIVAAINARTASTGVQASLATTVTTGDITVSTGTGTINGAQVTIDTANLATSVDGINALSTQTGVTAAVSGTSIVLSNSDGSTINVDGAAFGGAPESYQAGIVLGSAVSNTDFVVAGTFTVEGGGTGLGGAQANQTVTGTNILTRSDATDALLTMDFALQQVNSLRAELGAVQIRFESTIGNLQVTSENLSAARSRIQDADFAAETAELTRAQILQQAGLAIVAQANVLTRNALVLLQ